MINQGRFLNMRIVKLVTNIIFIYTTINEQFRIECVRPVRGGKNNHNLTAQPPLSTNPERLEGPSHVMAGRGTNFSDENGSKRVTATFD